MARRGQTLTQQPQATHRAISTAARRLGAISAQTLQHGFQLFAVDHTAVLEHQLTAFKEEKGGDGHDFILVGQLHFLIDVYFVERYIGQFIGCFFQNRPRRSLP